MLEFWEEFQWLPKVKLEKRLKDILEDDVEEKYYLSNKMIKGFVKSSGDGKLGFINQDTQASQVISSDGLSNTLCAGTHGYSQGYIKEPKIQGEHKVSLNIKKSVRDNFIRDYKSIIKTNKKIWYSDCKSGFQDNKVCIKESACLRANNDNLFTLDNNFRIRKITPRECFRLQDFDDTFKFVVSNSQLYKQAGNSISVNISEMIFRQIELSKNENMNKNSLF